MTQAVWITGVGSLTSLGVGLSSLIETTLKPRSHFLPMPPEWRQYSGAPAAFMSPLDEAAERALSVHTTISTDRSTAMALAVAEQAYISAELSGALEPERAGVFWGTGMGGLHTTEASYQRQLIDKLTLRPMTVVKIMANAAAGQIALRYGFQGPNQTYSVACASSAMAIGEAMWAVRTGRLDIAIVGGSEAMLVPIVMTAWGALGVLATHQNTVDHAQPCRPFSVHRSGLVIGEGAAAFVLESEQHARKRGAIGLAEVAGYASTCDATSMVKPDMNGQIRAMRMAIADAGISPEQIDSVNAHATGTDTGDVVEAKALAHVFGEAQPAIAATKSMHGHLLGATGAVEAAFCVAAIQAQTTPATLGLEPIDESCQFTNVATAAKKGTINSILTNSFAFGGSNTSLVLRTVRS
jgi:3-oxoacyl-(acyl-carrier-protein) synthase